MKLRRSPVLPGFIPRRALGVPGRKLALILALAFCPPLPAQTIPYSSGQTRSTPINTDDEDVTLELNSGSATQSGVISGSGGFNKIGAGSLTLTGTNTYTGTAAVSEGTLIFSGGTTGSTGPIQVGLNDDITATLNITAGNYAPTSYIQVGTSSSAIGIVNQSGGAVALSGAQLLIAEQGTGIYNLSGGSLTTSSSSSLGVLIGVNAQSTATFNLSGTGILNAANAYLLVGRPNYSPAKNITSNYNQSGGTATAGTLLIGGAPQAGSNVNATFSITGGTFSATSFTYLAAGGGDTATLTIGGAAQVTLPAFPTARGSGATTSITFDSTTGYLSPTASSTTYLPEGSFGHANLTANGANFNTAGYNITVAQILEDKTTGGRLTKSGAGTLTLSGANTFTGGTTVSAGTLTLGSSSTLSSATGTLTVAGGTLSSSVSATTLGGHLTLTSGSISPNGTSAGTFTLASGKTFTMSGGTLDLTLGSSFDQIISAGSGTLSLTGGTISFDTSGAGFSYASSYQIFSGFGSASFGALTLTGYDATNYIASISNTGSLSFSASAIPEPSTYAALFGGTALGFAAWRRRKAAAAAITADSSV